MPICRFASSILPFKNFNRSILLNFSRKIIYFSIDFDSKCFFCKSLTDTFCNFKPGYTVIEFACATIRERYFDFVIHSKYKKIGIDPISE